ncbi:MAG: alpha/beta hydrolase [Henriciella sp.]|nr:alpha/beta hydrolase [Henriciella sp.]
MTATMPTHCEKPSLFSTVREFGTPLQFLKFPTMARSLLSAPRGDGRKIVLLPGFTSPELAMQPLASYLSFLGYDASTWGLGINRGDVDGLTDEFGRGIETMADATGEPVTLIGWSLGGVIARETARHHSASVREIITMGSPLIGGPKYTSIGGVYARMTGMDVDMFEQEVHERNRVGLDQPITAIFSKSDGVVGWTAAQDPYNEQTRHVEVRSTHFGLGVNPTVWKIVAETLAAKNAL